MKIKKYFFLVSFVLISFLTFGQTDPDAKEKVGYLKSSGAIVHSHSQMKSFNTFKATKNNANTLTGKPGKSDYSDKRKDYTKKKVTVTGPPKTTNPKQSKVYKLYAPKTNSPDPFNN